MGWLLAGLLVSAIVGGTIAVSEGNKNRREQEKNREMIREENALTREREDNAVLRRAEDLEAAGLSKTLAAGSAAGATNVTPTQAPEHTSGQRLLDTMGVINNLIHTDAQNQLIQQQINEGVAREAHQNIINTHEDQRMLSQIAQAGSMANSAEARALIDKHDHAVLQTMTERDREGNMLYGVHSSEVGQPFGFGVNTLGGGFNIQNPQSGIRHIGRTIEPLKELLGF